MAIHTRRTSPGVRENGIRVMEQDVRRAGGALREVSGLPGGTRTPDLLLRRQLLYPVELRAAEAPSYPAVARCARAMPRAGARMIGRSDRIRTYDPLVPHQMRYQTALRSDWNAF